MAEDKEKKALLPTDAPATPEKPVKKAATPTNKKTPAKKAMPVEMPAADEDSIVPMTDEHASEPAAGPAPSIEDTAPAIDTAPAEAAGTAKKWFFKNREDTSAHDEGPGAEKPPKPPKEPKPPKPSKTEEQRAKEARQKENFKQKIWVPFLRPVVVLAAICLITSLLLGITNEITAPIIAQNAATQADQVRENLLPAADGFAQVPLAGDIPNITSMYQANNGAGYVIEAYAQGYGGPVPVMVAFDADGNIAGVQFLENDETPGLGQQLVTDTTFADQFVGLPGQPVTPSDVDRISSATVSSNAAITAINAAIALYNEQVLGIVAGEATPEQVREMLLPDATSFTQLSVSAPDVTEAWKGDDGNYIIYAQASGIYGQPVTAAVAMDPSGVILGLWLDTSNETQGYGLELADNQAFVDSFIGKSAPVTVAATPADDPGAVDAVAGATVTSNAVGTAVNAALAALPAAKEAG